MFSPTLVIAATVKAFYPLRFLGCDAEDGHFLWQQLRGRWHQHSWIAVSRVYQVEESSGPFGVVGVGWSLITNITLRIFVVCLSLKQGPDEAALDVWELRTSLS